MITFIQIGGYGEGSLQPLAGFGGQGTAISSGIGSLSALTGQAYGQQQILQPLQSFGGEGIKAQGIDSFSPLTALAFDPESNPFDEHQVFSPLAGFGGQGIKAQGIDSFSPLEGTAYELELNPGTLNIGVGILIPLAGIALGLTGGLGQGSGSLRRLASLGSNFPYGSGGGGGGIGGDAGPGGGVEGSLLPLTAIAIGELISPDIIFSTATARVVRHVTLPSSLIILGSAATAIKRAHVIAGSLGEVFNPSTARGRYHLLAGSTGVVISDATYRGEQGETWLFNATTYAASRVRGYFFDSFATLQGAVFGANAAGIFEITGDTDDGVAIDSSIIVGRSASRAPNVKRFSYGYVYGVSDDVLIVRVADDDATVYNYETERVLGTVVRSQRFKVGKGLKMHYWQFALENQGGTYFEVEHVDLLPAILERWVK